jgi:hypothetical protein
MSNYLAFIKAQMSEGTVAAREEVLHEFIMRIKKRREHPSALFYEGQSGSAMDSALTHDLPL